MISLQPQQYFTVVRQVADSTDATQYYVRAVIRNAYTDVVIATLDLTSMGDQRFKKDWLVPADPSGQGFYISIVTDVYSDAGYTTKNPLFETEEDTYLVFDRMKASIGAGGTGVDYYSIRKIIQEEIKNIKFPEISIPTPVEIKDRTEEVLEAIGAIKIVNKAPVIDIQEIIGAIKNNNKEGKIDFSPIIETIDATNNEIKSILDKVDSSNKDVELSRSEIKLMFKELEYRLIEKITKLTEEKTEEPENEYQITTLTK